MTTRIAKTTEQACQLGSTSVRLQAMYQSDGAYRANIAMDFSSGSATGLTAGFHASTAEAREFARQLIDHCDEADAKQAEAAAAQPVEA